ncbi:hypothetical protein P9G40_05570 [Bacillus velezensis]|uniref:hypothetical protein n=1 Tax=Bacillus amyloliquefaciens group TaxID=1938374 RepID=UPI00070D58A4|nr:MULTISPECIES: hypothetical protein [Bacillus amyloliquefaciens group]MEC2150809.1 hypothetical protein [Bacillus velezensis]MEC2154637.1 hypothetical protein [Bacillus velezensis]
MNLYKLVNLDGNVDSVASAYISAMETFLEVLKEDHKALKQALSTIDKHLSTTYHEIEKSNFNGVQGYYFAKEIKEILQKRRVIKGEKAKLKSIIKSLSSGVKNANATHDKVSKKDQELRGSLNTLIGFSDVVEDIWK